VPKLQRPTSTTWGGGGPALSGGSIFGPAFARVAASDETGMARHRLSARIITINSCSVLLSLLYVLFLLLILSSFHYLTFEITKLKNFIPLLHPSFHIEKNNLTTILFLLLKNISFKRHDCWRNQQKVRRPFICISVS
jgi:hypothetical protein